MRANKNNIIKSVLFTVLIITTFTHVLAARVYHDPKGRFKINFICSGLKHTASQDWVKSKCGYRDYVNIFEQVQLKTYFNKTPKQIFRILKSTIAQKVKSIKKDRLKITGNKVEMFRGGPMTIITYEQRSGFLHSLLGSYVVGIFVYRHSKGDFTIFQVTTSATKKRMLKPRSAIARERFNKMLKSLVFGKYKRIRQHVRFNVINILNKFRGKHIDELYTKWGVPQDERMTSRSKFLIYKFYWNDHNKLKDYRACTITFRASTKNDRVKTWDLRIGQGKYYCNRLLHLMYQRRGLLK